MTRRLPEISPPPEFPTGAPETVANLTIAVVTPMFGGGANPGQSDDDWPVRPPAIRGSLRFWWRACNARRFETVGEMRNAENCIWGSAAREGDANAAPGVVAIRVTCTKAGNIDQSLTGPSSAVFSFQENNSTGEAERPGRRGSAFTLRLTLAPGTTGEKRTAAITAVRQSLWAWLAFGGVGARTRRGCGSLRVTGGFVLDADGTSQEGTALMPASLATLGDWFQANLPAVGKQQRGNRLTPALHGCMMIAGASSRAVMTVWEDALEPMRQFRQGFEVGRNRGTGEDAPRPRPGQSRWPEPGAIRGMYGLRRVGTDTNGHEYKYVINADGRFFPRADLGLPIVFQMERDDRNAASFTATLQGNTKGRERLASPFILKPLALRDGSFVPLALLLDAPHVWDAGTPGIALKRGEHGTRHLTATPMKPLPVEAWPWVNRPPHVEGKESAREAFTDYLEQDYQWKRIVP